MKASAPPGKEDAAPRKNVNKSNNGVPSTNKPLHKFRFYLDVKNHITASKLELKIKELGGILELFLIREITHVVTDREEWSNSKGAGSTPKTPQFVPNESFSNGHGSVDEASSKRGRPKTRADAMLERARKTPTVVTKDPLEEARNWGITIWTVDKTFAFLEQVLIKIAKKRKSQKFFDLKSPYIKFEDFNRQTRPIFQEIRNWPQINFQGSLGDPGIIIRSTAERNMTRKTRSNHPRLDTALQPGYCELCRADYPRLDEHLESEKHLNFIKDNSNFLQLDTLINSTTNIDSFLKLNGVNKVDDLSALGNINSKRMLRPRTVSLCDKIKNSPLSPTGSDSGHRLRSRRHCVVNNYVGSIAEEDGLPVKPEGAKEVRELRSSARQLMKLVENEQKDTWDSGRPKRSCIKQRSSVEDRLLSEGKLFYKVEVLPNKVRSSELCPKEYDTPKKIPAVKDNSEAGTKGKGLIVKFKKMCSYELRQLNNEAENFLFPKKEESSSEEDIDADNPNTTASCDEGDSTVLLSSENDEEAPRVEEVKNLDEASLDSNWSECSTKKKKRRTHAEAFILDNQKYYKFETPGSRLRYHGSYLAPIVPDAKSPRRNGQHSAKVVKQEVKAEEAEKSDKLDLEELVFSFERVPKSEPWYQTFKRQDQGQDYYPCFSDSGNWKPFLLPYQLGRLPPLDPRICIKAYQDVKKELLETPSTSAGNTPAPNAEDTEDCSQDSEDSITTAEARDEDNSNFEPPKPKGKRRCVPVGKNPRKSPRQHASTLAILSSLLHQRKRRSDYNKPRTSSSPGKPLPPIVEKNELYEEKGDEEIDYDEVARKMEEELESMDCGNLWDCELTCEEESLIRTDSKLSAADILREYDMRETEGVRIKNTVKRIYSPGKRPGRKKKKNRTGWPNKNNRRSKKEEVLKEDGDDKSLDSVSVHSDCVEENDTGEVFSDKSGNGNLQSEIKSDDIKCNKQDRVSSDKSDRVVDLDKWETAEKVLSAKLTNGVDGSEEVQFQPVVRVQKLDSEVRNSNRRLRSSSSPHRTVKRPRRLPPSPKSPRILRRPRGRWYRER